MNRKGGRRRSRKKFGRIGGEDRPLAYRVRWSLQQGGRCNTAWTPVGGRQLLLQGGEDGVERSGGAGQGRIGKEAKGGGEGGGGSEHGVP
jgi:hypothetical protein